MSSGHLESKFDKSAEDMSLEVRKNYKFIIFPSKRSSGQIESSFDNPAEKRLLKVRKIFA